MLNAKLLIIMCAKKSFNTPAASSVILVKRFTVPESPNSFKNLSLGFSSFLGAGFCGCSVFFFCLGFFCRLRIGFVKIILYPPVPKKKKPKKKKKTEQPQKPAPKKEEKQMCIRDRSVALRLRSYGV